MLEQSMMVPVRRLTIARGNVTPRPLTRYLERTGDQRERLRGSHLDRRERAGDAPANLVSRPFQLPW